MKRFVLLLLVLCCLLSACGGPDPSETIAVPTLSETEIPAEMLTEVPTEASTEAPTVPPTEASLANVIAPLPGTIEIHNLDNCVVAVSLKQGDAFVDDTGVMRMTVAVYTYDLYDLVDISRMQNGDTIIIRGEEVVIEALDRTDTGLIRINGGPDMGGYDLWTEENTVYFETGYSDMKYWKELGTATVQVSADFIYTDRSNLDTEPTVYYPGDFLTDSGLIDYDFDPQSTTVTIQDGCIVSMERAYTP